MSGTPERLQSSAILSLSTHDGYGQMSKKTKYIKYQRIGTVAAILSVHLIYINNIVTKKSNMQYLTKSLAFVMIIFSTYLSASAIQVRWQRITDQEAGFTINFPGRPSYSESTIAENGQPMESYSFFYNGHTLAISFNPIIPPPRTALQVNQILSNTAEVYAKSGGTLLQQEKLPDGGRQFDTISSGRSGTLHLRARVYIHRGQFFMLSCGSYDVNGIDEQIADQFFSSFSFMDSVSKRPTTARNNITRRSSSGAAKPTRWYIQRGEDGDFIVEFPAKPDFQLTPAPDSNTTLHQYQFFFGENYFMVAYRNVTELADTPEQFLQRTLDNYVSGYSGWQLLRKIRLSTNGYQVELQGVAEGFPIQMQTRLYLRGTRLYFVTSYTKNLSGPNKADVNRFFGSFRFL
jgi:hypothetical protein